VSCAPHADPLACRRPAGLTAKDLAWAPRRSAPILQDICFSVDPGQIVGVIGPNGAGKSSLLRLLYRYRRPTQGQILIDGSDIWARHAAWTAQQVAVVIQEQAGDASLSVWETVALGRTPHRRGAWQESAADRYLIAAALARLELDRLAQRDCFTLSGGERQRVTVARALVQAPRLLILDEPTNHLDIRHQLSVLQLLRELGLTVVASLHDINLAASTCDAVLLIEGGRALGFGPADEVLSEERVSRAFSVSARRDSLRLGGRSHFTFHL